MSKKYDVLALFSGGLDSILAIKVVQEQGLSVLGLHFCTPFFGNPDKIDWWQETYDIDLQAIEVGQEYVDMMLAGPKFGYGKVFNPCVDCKIFMLSKARELMEEYGAKVIISGEVRGQRPMSQRLDALNAISKTAGVRDVLVRPLCARNMEPTQTELDGNIDREQLLSIGGRGRKEQLALAKKFNVDPIPTPAGGCLLAEKETAKRYLQLFARLTPPTADDFYLCNAGRQYWSEGRWLTIGRNQEDNGQIATLAKPEDILFDVRDYPSPLALARNIPNADWTEEAIADAAAYVASFSPKAKKAEAPIVVTIEHEGQVTEVSVTPERSTPLGWHETTWPEGREIKQKLLCTD